MAPRDHREPSLKFPMVPRGSGELETLIATIHRLARAHTIEEVMNTATTAARRLLDADGITFVMRDQDLCYYADEDAISPLWKGKRFPMDACISGWCMKRRKAVAISDIYADDRIPHDAYRPTFVRSLAMVPVLKEDPVGAMGAYWAEQREVAPEELALLQTMADSASLAIANVELQHKKHAAELMRQESAHRIKNIFSVALALVENTGDETQEAYREAVRGRLLALEKTHSAIFEADKGTLDVRELLKTILSAYTQDDRLELQSDDIRLSLSDSEASDLALIFNELGANAAKYGAWSTPEGRVMVTCQPTENGLHVTWRETGGPPVTRPSHQGFGSKLLRAVIQQALAGDMELCYPPEGFYFEANLPLGNN